MQYMVDTSKFEIHTDLGVNSGTIPPEILITNLIPDIVIIDKVSKTLDIWELTVPFESNISKRHTDKQNKYAHYISDITSHKVTVTAFEVGARGFLTPDNLNRLKLFHKKYCNTTTKQGQFIKNLSSITINSSYYIYNCRHNPTWMEPSYLNPRF